MLFFFLILRWRVFKNISNDDCCKLEKKIVKETYKHFEDDNKKVREKKQQSGMKQKCEKIVFVGKACKKLN